MKGIQGIVVSFRFDSLCTRAVSLRQGEFTGPIFFREQRILTHSGGVSTGIPIACGKQQPSVLDHAMSTLRGGFESPSKILDRNRSFAECFKRAGVERESEARRMTFGT